MIWASVVTSAPNSRAIAARDAGQEPDERAEQARARKSIGQRQREREPLGVGEGEGLRDELGEDDREQGEDDRDDDERDGRRAVPASKPEARRGASASSSTRLTAA